jgi:hypothetical protein
MSFNDANMSLHTINQLYLIADPPANYNFNQYINLYLYNCTNTSNVNFLMIEKSNFSYHGLLYSLTNFAITFLNDINNPNVNTNIVITNFFGSLYTMRGMYLNILENINFGSFIRSQITYYVKNQSTNNKLMLFNSIQTSMGNSVTYPEYSLVNTLNTSSALLQMNMITDSLEFSDTYNTFPSVNMSLTNNGIQVNNNLLVNNSYTNLSQFQDNEVVNAAFLKYLNFDNTTNTFFVNGNKAFSFK